MTSSQFGVTEGKCKKALGYYQQALPIIDFAMTTDPGKVMGRAFVENIYHSVFAYPKDTWFARRNAELLTHLGIPLSYTVGGHASE